MKNLYNFLLESLINEGGMAGHMAHPIDYIDFTAKDLKDLITDIFSGKIEDITEKIDGTNIQATINNNGDVVFIRNNTDLNNINGGMTIEDMANKWADKPSVAKTFLDAGEIITRVFKNIDPKFFNPSPSKKLVTNCECVIAGVTNIIPYAEAQVDFHDIHIYVKDNDKWKLEEVTKKGLDVIDAACKKVDSAKITPKVIIEITKESNNLINKYHSLINKLIKDDNISINDWKYNEFLKYINKDHSWIINNPQGSKILYNRWFNNDKSTNIRLVKQMYPENVSELTDLDKKGYKDIISNVTDPLDQIFMGLGNDVIKLCKGLINGTSNDNIIKRLQNDMKDVINDVRSNGNIDTQSKLMRQLQRLESVGGESSINSAEGIVFRYRGKLMKLTGSFAPLNQILGSIKFSR